MRKSFIAGNWKMNKTLSEARELAIAVSAGVPDDTVDVAVIPPFLAIPKVAEALEGTNILVGAQDVYHEKSGAFTGEISCGMIIDAGCSFALVGHSERRHVIGESNESIRLKQKALVSAGIGAILCVGEKIEEREASKTEAVLDVQVRSALEGFDRKNASRLTIAYEPVWAIGTGKNATADQAEQAHLFIRSLLGKLFGDYFAETIRIQYGGSVKPDNARELMSKPNVDGALVGGASLDAKSFLDIVNASK